MGFSNINQGNYNTFSLVAFVYISHVQTYIFNAVTKNTKANIVLVVTMIT